MNNLLANLSDWTIAVSDAICGYPEFLLLIGGGLFLFFYSGCVSVRRLPWAMRALRQSRAAATGKNTGQISSMQALLSAIAATVGMGNIAGVAIALSVGGPGVIFWMWVSALVGMSTKFFEGALAIMYKGTDSAGEPQGGPMYIIMHGMGPRWRWLAVAFSVFGLIGTLCFMQANQLVESITTVFTTPMGIADTFWLRFSLGVIIAVVVGAVILGGIGRIAKWASRIVPMMVALYLLLVLAVTVLHLRELPGLFGSIFAGAFTAKAALGELVRQVVLTGSRRAAMVNEAGVGTASMMHGASHNTDPMREGLIAMVAPAIDSGLVCTLTSIPILLAGNYHVAQPMGLHIALGAFGQLLPGVGQYLLMAIVFCFAFSTMFSYSYYGQKCTNFLFGAHRANYYNYFYLVMIVVAAVLPLATLVSLMDLAFALMAACTMTALLTLAPKVKAQMRTYFAKPQQS